MHSALTAMHEQLSSVTVLDRYMKSMLNIQCTHSHRSGGFNTVLSPQGVLLRGVYPCLLMLCLLNTVTSVIAAVDY